MQLQPQWLLEDQCASVLDGSHGGLLFLRLRLECKQSTVFEDVKLQFFAFQYQRDNLSCP